MSIERDLIKRSASVCELCGSTENLVAYSVPPVKMDDLDHSAHICSNCHGQIENPDTMDANHWRCLNDSMWSEVPAVQALAWRMLSRLKAEGWPQDLLDMMYLEEDTLEWAKATGEGADDDAPKHRDSNGIELKHGDSVVVTKDLNVKGSSIVAKRGTAVRNITLVKDDPTLFEGKVGGQTIYILCKFVKKLA
jgi:protein PhnA